MKNGAKIAAQYAFAVAIVALTSLVRWWLEKHVGPMPLFITWYPAILVVASVTGGGPGILATILSALAADYWFVAPVGKFSIVNSNDAVAMGIFVGTSIFVSVLAQRLRSTRWAQAVSVTQEKELALLNMGNVMALDLDHRIVRWSEGNHRLYGYEAQEAQGKSTYDLLQTHVDKSLEQIHSQLMEKGHWEGQVTRRTKDGTQLSLALLWALRRDEYGKGLAILEVSTDITGQKTAEESLRQQSEELAQQNEELTQQSEELSQQNEELQTQSEEIQSLNVDLGHREKILQTLLDSARLPLGEKEVVEKICRAAMEMIGPAAVGAAVCERHDDQLQIIACAGFDLADVPVSRTLKGSFVEMMLQQDRTACLEDASLRPDLNNLRVKGHQPFAAVLASPVHIKGKCVGAVTIFSNTVQQWTAEQFKLIEWLAAKCSNTLEAMRLAAEILHSQKQNEFLAGIIEASSQAFGVGYPDGRLGLINKAFEQLTGYSGDELRSIDWAEKLTPPEWMEVERKKLDELHHTGQSVRYEKEYLRKDGTRVPIELLVHLVKDADDKPLYYYSFITDITERKRAQEALIQSQERLDLALSSAMMATFDWDIVKNKRTWSSGVHRLLGTRPETFTGTAEEFFQVIHPEDRSAVQAALAKAIETSAPYESEYRSIWPDGSIHHITARGLVHHDNSGRPVRLTGICWDITQRKEAENILQATVQRFYVVLSSMYSGILLVTDDGRVEFANQAFCDQFGLADSPAKLAGLIAGEMIAKIKNAYLHPDEAVVRIREIVEQGQPIKNEELTMQDGRTCLRDFIPLNVQGKSYGRLWLHNDITESKRAEEALREAKSQLEIRVKERTAELTQALAALHRTGAYTRSLIEASLDPLVTIGPDGKITDVNAATERATGLKRQELIGTDYCIYFTEPDKARMGYQQVFKEGSVRDYPLDILHRDGHTIPVLYNAALYRDDAGEVVGIFAAARDITQRKRAEKALREANETLEQRVAERTAELTRSNKELEQFAYIASHDLQEPLRQVRAFVELLRERYAGTVDEKAAQYFKFVHDGSARMTDLVRGLLEFARVGAQQARHEGVSCQKSLDTALANLQAGINESHARVTHDDLPTIVAEPTHMTQLFQNLIGNAIKFRRDGVEPQIHVGCRRDDNHWLFWVKDNGIGIDTKHQDRVFMIFQRLHGREKYPGTGIGLSICKKIVEQHGGKIWIESKPGEGSTFYFTLIEDNV